MPEAVIKKALEELPSTSFYQAYGQTETGLITILAANRHTFEGELAGKIKAAGQAIPGVDLAILDESGNPVTVGEVGEVCIFQTLFISHCSNHIDRAHCHVNSFPLF